ncbi:MAG: hypothetical protein ACJA1I_000706 [Zhongshania marina]|jgi:hypothetical protein
MSDLIIKIVFIVGFATTFVALERAFGIASALFLLIVISLVLCFILDTILLLLTSKSGKHDVLLILLLGVMIGIGLRG